MKIRFYFTELRKTSDLVTKPSTDINSLKVTALKDTIIPTSRFFRFTMLMLRVRAPIILEPSSFDNSKFCIIVDYMTSSRELFLCCSFHEYWQQQPVSTAKMISCVYFCNFISAISVWQLWKRLTHKDLHLNLKNVFLSGSLQFKRKLCLLTLSHLWPARI